MVNACWVSYSGRWVGSVARTRIKQCNPLLRVRPSPTGTPKSFLVRYRNKEELLAPRFGQASVREGDSNRLFTRVYGPSCAIELEQQSSCLEVRRTHVGFHLDQHRRVASIAPLPVVLVVSSVGKSRSTQYPHDQLGPN